MKQIDLVKQMSPIVYSDLKIENEFNVIFPKYMNFPEHVVISCDKPKFKKNKWGKMTLEFLDRKYDSTSQSLMRLIPNESDDKEKYIIINSVDNVGIVFEKWQIYFEKFNIDFGKYNKMVDNVNTVKLTIYPITCELHF